MSDIIRLLPDSVANQIAAGEVIQRPASVIKELVENAVDAGATEIQIVVRDAGRTLIQVVDNGKGMSMTDARLAFERHATSKISSATDLFALHTMGFRGEALPSICAISRVELRTRREEDSVGTCIVIEGSRFESQEACVCERGSNFMVKNLFFNVPARRRFLKSDAVELSNVVREFERLALANENIRFTLDTGTRRISLREGSFLQRIGELWKNNLNMQLLPIDVDTSAVKIKGYISRPEFARKRNALQYLLVNGRNMKHPYFHKAIVSCYDSLIAHDTQPCYFIRFEVDPGEIDVNIHPTKNEIKFENEQHIWPILTAAVKAALGKFAAMPSIDFNTDTIPVKPLAPGETPSAPDLGIDRNYNPFAASASDYKPFKSDSGSAGRYSRREGNYASSSPSARDWNKLYTGFMGNAKELAETPSEPASLPLDTASDNVEELPPLCIQCGRKYIAARSKEGLMIIDRYRAMVRILYEKFLSRQSGARQSVQRLMFAETVELDSTQQAALAEVENEIREMGISLDYKEDSEWQITAMPPAFDGQDAKDIVLRILDSVIEDTPGYGDASSFTVSQRVALAMARSAASGTTEEMSVAEMEHTVSELFKLPDPNYTPDGKKIVCLIEGRRLESLFD